MDTFLPLALRSCADESGVTAIEYGLMAALIAVSIIGALNATGFSLGAMYTFWTNAVITAISTAL